MCGFNAMRTAWRLRRVDRGQRRWKSRRPARQRYRHEDALLTIPIGDAGHPVNQFLVSVSINHGDEVKIWC